MNSYPLSLFVDLLSVRALRRGVTIDELLGAMRRFEADQAKSAGEKPFFWEESTRAEWERLFPGKRGISWRELLAAHKNATPAFLWYVERLFRDTFPELWKGWMRS